MATGCCSRRLGSLHLPGCCGVRQVYIRTAFGSLCYYGGAGWPHYSTGWPLMVYNGQRGTVYARLGRDALVTACSQRRSQMNIRSRLTFLLIGVMLAGCTGPAQMLTEVPVPAASPT